MIEKRLRQLRNAQKLTQQNIADVLGVDRTTYTYYELGTTMPSAETLIRLASIYKVTVGYLLGVEDNNPELLRDNTDNFYETMVAESEPLNFAELTKKENAIVLFYRSLDEGKQEKAYEFIRSLVLKSEEE